MRTVRAASITVFFLLSVVVLVTITPSQRERASSTGGASAERTHVPLGVAGAPRAAASDFAGKAASAENPDAGSSLRALPILFIIAALFFGGWAAVFVGRLLRRSAARAKAVDEYYREPPRPEIRDIGGLAAATIGALLVAALLYFVGVSLFGRSGVPPSATAPSRPFDAINPITEARSPSLSGPATDLPGRESAAASAVALSLLAAAVAAAFLFVRYTGRPSGLSFSMIGPGRRLRPRESPEDLDGSTAFGAEPLGAGIAALYAEMREELGRSLRFDEPVTPREYAQLAGAAGVDRGAVTTLTTLFESERYGHHPPGADEMATARRCLDAILRDSGRERGVTQ